MAKLWKLNWKMSTWSCQKTKKKASSAILKIKRPDYNIEDVRAPVQIIIDGHGCLLGYRSVWHALKLRGTRVPRIVVQELLREMDPESSENFVVFWQLQVLTF